MTDIVTLFRGAASRARAAGFLALVLLAAGAVPVPAQTEDVALRSRLQTARRLLIRGQATEAARLYEQILELHPGEIEATAGRADALTHLEQYEEAEAFLTEALEEAEQPIALLRRRLEVRRKLDRPLDAFQDVLIILSQSNAQTSWAFTSTRDLLQDGLDPDAAFDAADAARKRFPEQGEFAVLGGIVLAVGERFAEGLKLVADEDARRKQNGQTIKLYAEELLQLGYREPALTALLAAAERSEKSARRSQILFSAVDLLELEGRYQEALEYLGQIAEDREGSATAGKALIQSAAIYQNRLHDPEGALGVYERLENDPSLGHYRPEMFLQMGDCYVLLGKFDQAARSYALVLPEALDPEHAEKAAFRVAEVEFYRGNPDSALVLYQQMAETHSRSLLTDEAAARYILLNTNTSGSGREAIALLGRMSWAMAVGDSALADSAGSEITRLYGETEVAAEAWLLLAEISLEGNNPRQAVERLEQVVARFPENRRAAVALRRQGDVLLQEPGRREEALALYERILTDYPESVHAGEVRRLVQSLRQSL